MMQRDLAEEQPQRARALWQAGRARTLALRSRGGEARQPAALSSDAIERLRALGYAVEQDHALE
jgi:hypothetical protein